MGFALLVGRSLGECFPLAVLSGFWQRRCQSGTPRAGRQAQIEQAAITA
jgi:hypothetical protein